MNKIYVVGIGPGAYEKMTIEAAEALKASDTIIGYTVYVDLVKDHFADKRFLTTPMTKEVDRCVLAFEEAKKGHVVSMICSGGRRGIRHGRPHVRGGRKISGGGAFHYSGSYSGYRRSGGAGGASDS